MLLKCKKTSYLFFVLVFLSSDLVTVAQEKLQNIRRVADKELKSSFSKSVFNRINCTGYLVIGKNVGEGYGGDYLVDKNKKIVNKVYTLIFYSLFSKELNYTFYFHVIVDSTLKASIPQDEFANVPQCIKRGENCKFVSKRDAFLIAINDSIQYSDNLTASLKIPKGSAFCFWEISGQNKANIDYSKEEPKDGWPYFPIKRENTRYVNAVTGELISFDDYSTLEVNVSK